MRVSIHVQAALLAAQLLTAQEITLTPIVTGLSEPTDIQNAADGSGRLFIVQQAGRIRILRNGALLATPFLDISSKTRADGERGLLGLAFPPGFADKKRFYVNYTNLAGNTVIAMYRVSANPDIADAASETILTTIAQPFPNHNGGQLRFGPDGFLYVGMGDGGGAGDPFGNGRNRNVLLGKMLRIDVESNPGSIRIPASNPFATSTRPELWAIGMRNPWRFSFDRLTHDLWIADVGQDGYEEIDFQPASSRGGEDYGWNTTEGGHCYNSATCDMSGITLPVAEYSHTLGCSVSGGFVYRGRASAFLRGTYLYADYCSGRLFGYRAGTARVLLETAIPVTTFGEDEAGEIYLADAFAGGILRVDGLRAPQVTNAASFVPGKLVAGSLASVFVSGLPVPEGVAAAAGLPLPLTLAGVSLTVNGTPAPILAVANVDGAQQVNFQAPFGLTGTEGTVVVRIADASTTVIVPLAVANPGIFATASTGRAIVVRPDYTLVTDARPLVPGELVYLYATGLAPPANPPAAGAASPVLTTAAEVTLGGVSCPVQYAGLAPGFAGLYQVNFQVPASVRSGLQELSVRASGNSAPGVLVRVR